MLAFNPYTIMEQCNRPCRAPVVVGFLAPSLRRKSKRLPFHGNRFDFQCQTRWSDVINLISNIVYSERYSCPHAALMSDPN